MPSEAFSFEGGKALEKALGELGPAAGKRVAVRVLKKGAVPVRDKAKRLAPKDEMVLEDAIEIGTRVAKNARAAVGRERDGIVRVFVGIDQGAPQEVNIYSIVQEDGNPDTAAQPYFGPAWATEGPKAIDIIGPELWDDIDRTAKRAARKAARARS